MFQCLSIFVSFFIHMSGNTSKHHLNFMFMTELQHGQINSIAAITNTHFFFFFLYFQCLFVAGQAPVNVHLPHVGGSGFRYPVSFWLWNPESRKLLLEESGIQLKESEIPLKI